MTVVIYFRIQPKALNTERRFIFDEGGIMAATLPVFSSLSLMSSPEGNVKLHIQSKVKHQYFLKKNVMLKCHNLTIIYTRPHIYGAAKDRKTACVPSDSYSIICRTFLKKKKKISKH